MFGIRYIFSNEARIMPQITLKETITRKIDIPLDTLAEIIDNLSADDKKRLLSKLRKSGEPFKKFEKYKISEIISVFFETELYEDEFLADLEAGLKKSSVYRYLECLKSANYALICSSPRPPFLKRSSRKSVDASATRARPSH